jgi:hypothetical protein
VDQGYGQLTLLIGHLKVEEDTGKLILSFLSHLPLYVGSITPLFQLSFTPYAKWVGLNWITSVWSFTSTVNAVLKIEHQWVPFLPLQHDVSTIDVALGLNFTPVQYKQFNNCCIYLQVITLADIILADGKHILPEMECGDRDGTRSITLHWLVSHHPAHWTTWQIFLQHISTGRRLLKPLGPWLTQPHQQWQWFHDPDNDLLYNVINTNWTSYHRSTPGRT